MKKIYILLFALVIFLTACGKEDISLHRDSFVKWHYDSSEVQFYVHLINERNRKSEPAKVEVIIKNKDVAAALGNVSNRVPLAEDLIIESNNDQILESGRIPIEAKGINEQMLSSSFQVRITLENSNHVIEYELNYVNVIKN